MSIAKTKPTMLVLSVLAFVLYLNPAAAQTDTVAKSDDSEQVSVEAWHEVYDSIADTFVVQQHSSATREFNSQVEILTRKTMSSVSTQVMRMRQGRVYIWTDKGLPIALGSVKSVLNPGEPVTRTVFYEFHSLSQGGVLAARDGNVFWHCEKPGIKWLTGIEESKPSTSPTARLTQMKFIARSLTCTNIGESVSHPKLVEGTSRLLPTPLYRYPAETPDVLDGAIFAFAKGTDPDLFLLIEARSDAWHLAFARSNTRRLLIKKGEELLWTFDEARNLNDIGREPFYLKWIAEVRLNDNPETVLFQARLRTLE